MTAGRSLRTRLVAAVMATGAVVLISSGVVLYFLVRASLLQELDSALVQQAQVMTSVLEWKDGRVDLELGKLTEPQKVAPGDHRYFEVWQQGEGLLARSPSLGKASLPRPKGVSPSPRISFAKLPGGHRVRLVVLTVRPRQEGADERASRRKSSIAPQVTLLLAGDLGRFETSLTQLAYLLAAVGLAAILATVGGAWWAVGFGLRPMRALARRIEDLGGEDLGRRVDLPAAPTELLSVVERLNQLLERLEAAFGREKALLANLAHELRTPLAGLGFTLEVSLSRPRGPREYADDLRQCLSISRQMQGMVDNLLTMARLDAGQGPLEGARQVNLDEALRQVWGTLREQALQKSLRMDWSLAPGTVVRAEPHALQIILRNLLANAVDYADQGGNIWLIAKQRETSTELTVGNTGCHLSPSDAEQVFERFWRGDASRSGEQAHAGLGLALSRQLADSMQGSLEAACDEQGRFMVTLRLPSSEVRSA